jgi:HK97 family phage portal protein
MGSVISRLFGADPALDDRYWPRSGGAMSLAGVPVSPEAALRVSAVYRCVSIVANVLAMMPGGIFEELAKGSRRATENPMDVRLRLTPNDRQTAFEYRRQLFTSLLLRSNAYSQIVPAGPGAFDLIPLHPDRIRGPEQTASGELRYVYTPPGGKPPVPLIGGVDLWHLQGLSEDGIRGLSMVDLARDAIGIAKAGEEHSATTYARGVTFAGILEHPKRLTPETAGEMGDSFGRRYGGGGGVGKVPVLWEGMQFKPISMTNKDAEYIESRKFSVADIARWFGVPPHLIGDVERSTSWGTGIEEQNLMFLMVTLLPWITLFEQSYRRTLLLRPDRFYPKLNINVLLRASAKVRFDVYQIGIANGILSPNECRDMEDRNPREGGDEYVDPSTRGSAVSQPIPGQQADAEKRMLAIAERLALQLRAIDEGRSQPLVADPSLATRAQELARATAERIVTEEMVELARLSETAGGDSALLARAEGSFFGRHAAYVAESLRLDVEVARAYCRERKALGPGQAVARLVALAVS